MILAPIVLFVYNRPWHTQQTLDALVKNELAEDSILYVFADGAKQNPTAEDLNKIKQVHSIIEKQKGFKEIHFIKRDRNFGLADNIVSGVTEIVNKYGKIIVIEDDIVTSIGFLKYMNVALNYYIDNSKVFHISGYMYPHNQNLPETFFYNVTLCWGWATWKRAWYYYENDTIKLVEYLNKNKKWDELNRFGGDFLESQLLANKSGKLKTWFIKWHASTLMQNGYTLYPNLSLVNNIGFDNSGENNGKTDDFHHRFLKNKIEIEEIPLIENNLALLIIKNFYYKLNNKSILNKIKSLIYKLIT